MQTLLNSRELAAILKVKESYLKNLRHENRVPFLKIGRLVRYSLEDIEKWIASGECRNSISMILD